MLFRKGYIFSLLLLESGGLICELVSQLPVFHYTLNKVLNLSFNDLLCGYQLCSGALKNGDLALRKLDNSCGKEVEFTDHNERASAFLR
jgi:hypothetical protein